MTLLMDELNHNAAHHARQHRPYTARASQQPATPTPVHTANTASSAHADTVIASQTIDALRVSLRPLLSPNSSSTTGRHNTSPITSPEMQRRHLKEMNDQMSQCDQSTLYGVDRVVYEAAYRSLRSAGPDEKHDMELDNSVSGQSHRGERRYRYTTCW